LLQAPNAQRRQYDSFGIADQCRSGTDVADASQSRAWLDEHRIATLNVAGNRASQAPEIAQLVRAALELRLRDAHSFSGGNQQKLVLAREMEHDPDLLLVGQPTRGVDIGAIEFIHRRLIAMRDAGKAVLLVSVELDEILSLSDRILVMFDGTITGELSGAEADERRIGLLMAGITKEAA
jgi:ABC-type uncharacterized transport system ATPase subunit